MNLHRLSYIHFLIMALKSARYVSLMHQQSTAGIAFKQFTITLASCLLSGTNCKVNRKLHSHNYVCVYCVYVFECVLYVCICMYVRTYVCMYVCTYVGTCMYIFVCVCKYVNIYICVCVGVHICSVLYSEMRLLMYIMSNSCNQ